MAPSGRRSPKLDRDLPVPGQVLADEVLELTCAVSERVSAADPVHRDSLPIDIQDLLLSTALAVHVPDEEIDKAASGIARKRAETDIRVDVARKVAAGEIFEVRARFYGNPDYPSQTDIDAYEANLTEGMKGLQRETPAPTEIERRVARAVVATRVGSKRHGLALAMSAAMELGTPATDGEIRKGRQAVLAELQEGPKSMESFRERSLLRRTYRNFAGAEVRELSQGSSPFLEGHLPDDKAREQAVKAVHRLHRKSWSTEPSPWRLRHETIVRSSGAGRGGGRERGRHRGRGRGAEIEQGRVPRSSRGPSHFCRRKPERP